MSRFYGISSVATVPDIPPGLVTILDAIITNIALLTGQRGEADRASEAITRGSVTIAEAPTPQITRVTATGGAIVISGAQVATAADVEQLKANLQAAIDDNVRLRQTVNALIVQLKGR